MWMKKGYIEMAEINARLSEEGVYADNEALFCATHNDEAEPSEDYRPFRNMECE
jgi:hypothetical protein